MLQSKRFTKIEKKKRRIGLFIWLLSLLPILVFVLFLSFYLKKPLFVSPVPFSSFKIQFFNANDGKRELSDKLTKAHIQFNSVVSLENGYLVQLTTDEDIIFSNSKSLDKQISSLQLIMGSLTIEGKRIARLDLRFDNPVIVFR